MEQNSKARAHDAAWMIEDALGALRRKLAKNGYDFKTFKADATLRVDNYEVHVSLSWPGAEEQ